jgi:NNP family nitrate/nitrite transporter-like MFS transporter
MVVPGIALFIMGWVYYFFTQDTPEGNFKELRAAGKLEAKSKSKGAFRAALKDYRVWGLFLIYGTCFGVELTINNIAAMYYVDNFSLDLKTAGLIAGLFGLMNLFARSLGGVFGDKFGIKFGLKGRVYFLFAVLFLEGIMLVVFSQMSFLPVAILIMILFSLFVQMSEGATFSVVPFINKKAIGSVSGIVGAGGNAGAVAAGFLFKSESLTYQEGLFVLGLAVIVVSFATFMVRFSTADEKKTQEEMATSLAQKAQNNQKLMPSPVLATSNRSSEQGS